MVSYRILFSICCMKMFQFYYSIKSSLGVRLKLIFVLQKIKTKRKSNPDFLVSVDYLDIHIAGIYGIVILIVRLPGHLHFLIHLSKQLLDRENRRLNQRRPFCMKKNLLLLFPTGNQFQCFFCLEDFVFCLWKPVTSAFSDQNK